MKKKITITEDDTTLVNLSETAATYDGFYKLLESQKYKPPMTTQSKEPYCWLMNKENTQWIFLDLKPLLTSWDLTTRRAFAYPKKYDGMKSWIIFRGSTLECFVSDGYRTLKKHRLEIHWEDE